MQILGFKNHRHPDQHKLLFSQHMLEKAERVFEFGFETKTETSVKICGLRTLHCLCHSLRAVL